MKKEITEITFEDGIKGTITTETIKGRVDVRKNQVRSANTYIFETKSGRMFEVVATSENLAKKCVRFECCIDEKKLYTKEIKKADEIKQQKAKIGEYAEFINEYLPTPSDEPKTEDEEEAAAEHFVKQMSEPEPDVNTMIIKQKPEYMDARRLNNWTDLLIEKKYGMVREHDKIYCVTSYGKVFGWFWNVKGAQQFQCLYGGDILYVDSDLFFIEQIHDKLLEIICTVETDELSIESQLIYAGYLHAKENRPSYIFACLQSYTNCFELDMMVREHHMQQHELSIQKFLKCTYRELANNKDYEKSLLAFCKDMQYLTEQIIDSTMKECENNDNP